METLYTPSPNVQGFTAGDIASAVIAETEAQFTAQPYQGERTENIYIDEPTGLFVDAAIRLRTTITRTHRPEPQNGYLGENSIDLDFVDFAPAYMGVSDPIECRLYQFPDEAIEEVCNLVQQHFVTAAYNRDHRRQYLIQQHQLYTK